MYYSQCTGHWWQNIKDMMANFCCWRGVFFRGTCTLRRQTARAQQLFAIGAVCYVKPWYKYSTANFCTKFTNDHGFCDQFFIVSNCVKSLKRTLKFQTFFSWLNLCLKFILNRISVLYSQCKSRLVYTNHFRNVKLPM